MEKCNSCRYDPVSWCIVTDGMRKKDAVADNDDDWVVVGKDSEEPEPATESGTEVVSEDSTEDTESNSVFPRWQSTVTHLQAEREDGRPNSL